jgi:hypothetical protein
MTQPQPPTPIVPADLEAAITQAITRALHDPEQVIAGLKLYDQAEANDEHREEGFEMSILRFALGGYITQALMTADISVEDLGIEPYDTQVEISGELPDGQLWTVEVGYPEWLEDFFEVQDHFDLLKPDDNRSLSAGLAMLEDFVAAYGEDDLPEDEDDDDDDDGDDEDGDEEDDPGVEEDEAGEEDQHPGEDQIPQGQQRDEDQDDIRSRGIPLPHAYDSTRPATW